MIWGFPELGRLLFAPLYWNTRKTLARTKRPGCRCPGASPSDCALSKEVVCEASASWRKQSNFSRYVCPSLQLSSNGYWQCNAPRGTVPVYWGRAVLPIAVLIGALVSLAALTVYGLLVSTGLQIRPWQVVWPPAWHEIRAARADQFRRQAVEALGALNARQALAAIDSAAALAPESLETALLQAQVHHLADTGYTDTLYDRMWMRYPAQRKAIAHAWLNSILLRGDDGSRLGMLSVQMMREKDPDWPVWLNATLKHAIWNRDVALLRSIASDNTLPADARAPVRLELELQTQPRQDARIHLLTEPPGKHQIATIHYIERLIDFDAPDVALRFLEVNRMDLVWRDYTRLKILAWAAKRDPNALRAQARQILRSPSPPEETSALTILAQCAIASRDVSLAKFCLELPLQPGAGSEAKQAHEGTALYCLAALEGNADQLDAIRENWPLRIGVAEHRDWLSNLTFGRRPPIKGLLRTIRPVSMDLSFALLARDSQSRGK